MAPGIGETEMTHPNPLTEISKRESLTKFLKIVPCANWRHVPAVWSDQLRLALSDGLVTVGWGGVLKLTDEGRLRTKSESSHD